MLCPNKLTVGGGKELSNDSKTARSFFIFYCVLLSVKEAERIEAQLNNLGTPFKKSFAMHMKWILL